MPYTRRQQEKTGFRKKSVFKSVTRLDDSDVPLTFLFRFEIGLVKLMYFHDHEIDQ